MPDSPAAITRRHATPDFARCRKTPFGAGREGGTAPDVAIADGVRARKKMADARCRARVMHARSAARVASTSAYHHVARHALNKAAKHNAHER